MIKKVRAIAKLIHTPDQTFLRDSLHIRVSYPGSDRLRKSSDQFDHLERPSKEIRGLRREGFGNSEIVVHRRDDLVSRDKV